MCVLCAYLLFALPLGELQRRIENQNLDGKKRVAKLSIIKVIFLLQVSQDVKTSVMSQRAAKPINLCNCFKINCVIILHLT